MKALEGFRQGKYRVLVATDIAARGIDVEEITHVIQMDLPEVPEQYVHRIGRTARAGAGGIAWAFCSDDDRPLLRDIERTIRMKIDVAEHPWGDAMREMASESGGGQGSRWNPGKDLSFVPLRPELVAEVRYNHMDGRRLRHPAQFLRWRPDRDPTSCGFDQLEVPAPVAVTDILGG